VPSQVPNQEDGKESLEILVFGNGLTITSGMSVAAVGVIFFPQEKSKKELNPMIMNLLHIIYFYALNLKIVV
jgi:hypothetical protein